MKKILCSALTTLALVASAPVLAQAAAPAPASVQAIDPATTQAVRDLLAAMKYREMMSAAFEQMSKSLPAMVRQVAVNAVESDPKLSGAKKKDALAMVEKNIPQAVRAAQSIFADPKLVDEMIAEIVPLYARHFTVEEIGQVAVFYRTPVGVKMLASMPEIMNESMLISQKIMMPRVAKMIEKFTEVPAN
ncbi:hypothetical protein AAKU55_002478 [Oxalobacteraceae bacterium GrIS 1.11]